VTRRERLRSLLGLDESPRRIAVALAVGVFIGCTPFWGVQTLLAVLAARLLGLSRAATVAGSWLNLPWLAPLVYAMALEVGRLLVPGRVAALPSLHGLLQAEGLRWETVLGWIRALSVPFFVGTTVVGAAAAVVTYIVAVRLIARGRAGLGREVS